MFSASFLPICVLTKPGRFLRETTLLWCFPSVGIALSSDSWGRLADRYGHRPIVMFAMCTKPIIVVIFSLATPSVAWWILAPAFLIDSMWNAALMVATNGYMLRLAPPAQSPDVVAALTG